MGSSSRRRVHFLSAINRAQADRCSGGVTSYILVFVGFVAGFHKLHDNIDSPFFTERMKNEIV